MGESRTANCGHYGCISGFFRFFAALRMTNKAGEFEAPTAAMFVRACGQARLVPTLISPPLLLTPLSSLLTPHLTLIPDA